LRQIANKTATEAEPEGRATSGVHRVAPVSREPSLAPRSGDTQLAEWRERFQDASRARHAGQYRAAILRAQALFDAIGVGDLTLVELHGGELCADLRVLGADAELCRDVVQTLETTAPEGFHLGSRGQRAFALLAEVARRSLSSSSRPISGVEPIRAASAPFPAVGLIGNGPALRALRTQLRQLADRAGTVLLVGESGTGKERAAEATHLLSRRSAHPFIPVNCAALPVELMESELFGHERGAFTGSQQACSGLLRAAGEGTIFLDEITEMPIALQPKLLRALEQRRVRPVGGIHEVPFRARVVAATNRDPAQAVREGRLREDLFYRLCVHRVDMPPLRQCREDIGLLVEHFLSELSAAGHEVPLGFDPAALSLLALHDFPGNARELRNLVERVATTCGQDFVRPEHLAGFVPFDRHGGAKAAPPTAEPADGDQRFLSLREVEENHIRGALRLAQGNKTHAARLLGLSRHQLYIKLERLINDG